MKKIFMTSVLFLIITVLSGCDFLDNGEEQFSNAWYDENSSTINLSYTIPQGEYEEDTELSIIEHLYFDIRQQGEEDWTRVSELTEYNGSEVQIQYQFREYGDYEFRIVAEDDTGLLLREVMGNFYINEPQFIYHFDAYFDSWNGEIRFNFDFNYSTVSSAIIMKSSDGGLSWNDVLNFEVNKDENQSFKNELVYYEFDEGNYVYKLVALDELGEQLDEMTTWGEINVKYEEKEYEGEPDVWYLDANFNVYDNTVNIWWDSSGDYDKSVIEKSTDGASWEFVGEVPRMSQAFHYNETADGEYTYRVSLVKDEEIKVQLTSEKSVRVKQGAILGHFDGWIEWESNTVNLNWDFVSELVTTVRLERFSDDGGFELLGEFGSLKKMFTDIDLDPGVYTYRVFVLDSNGVELDSLETNEFEIVAPDYVYDFSVYFDQSSGQVQLYLNLNSSLISSYTVEKSTDGGLTWVEVVSEELIIYDDNWYQADIRFYELEEGNYVYKVSGFDSDGDLLGTEISWNEVSVRYDYLNLGSEVNIDYVSASYDIYSSTINLWWTTSGTYGNVVIEKSIDGVNFEVVAILPSVVTFYNFIEDVDGTYYYRVSAVTDEVTLSSSTTYEYLRVKEDSYISSFNVYFDFGLQQSELYWNIINEDVSTIKIEVIINDEVILVGEFGQYKTMLFDSVEENGTYVYRLSLYDEEGNLLDSIDSSSIEVYVE